MVSQLGLQLAEQLGVDGRASTSRRRICSAPLTASAATWSRSASRALRRFLLGLGLGRGDDLRAFLAGARLGFLDDRLRQALGVGEALGGVVARGRRARASMRLLAVGEFGLGLVGGRQAFGDLAARARRARR